MTPKAKFRAQSNYPRCLESHPPLKIGDHVIYGGSCSTPMVVNADVYVGFDGSHRHVNGANYPWNPGVSFLYHIADMHAPEDPESFKKLIEWLSVQLIANKLIHLGCIGGHGRTGLVLAALYKHVTGEADAITYVRKNYCEKAVESKEQVDFLHKHFGITPQPGAKAHTRSYTATTSHQSPRTTSAPAPAKDKPSKASKGAPSGSFTVVPLKTYENIWEASSQTSLL